MAKVLPFKKRTQPREPAKPSKHTRLNLCFNLNGTQMLLSDEILKSKESIDLWRGVFKRQSNKEHSKQFERILANTKRLRGGQCLDFGILRK